MPESKKINTIIAASYTIYFVVAELYGKAMDREAFKEKYIENLDYYKQAENISECENENMIIADSYTTYCEIVKLYMKPIDREEFKEKFLANLDYYEHGLNE